MRDRVWRTKRGKLIPVAEMETSHIQNCLRLIRKHGWRRGFEARMALELRIREMGLRGEQ